jgi:hypothetical protein
LDVESLEGRIALSTSYVPGAAVSAALVKGATYLLLGGSGRGTFRQPRHLPDVGVTDVFHGKARLSRLGAVKVTGALSGTGFILQGHAAGSLILRDARGSVTSDLTGPPEGGSRAPGSGTYTFAITGGTGAYARAIGTGKVDLVLGSGTFAMTFHGDPNRF